MKTKKKLALLIILLVTIIPLTAYTAMDMWSSEFKQNFQGISMHVQTFDVKSRVIDDITMKSMKIDRDTTFDDNSGEDTKKSKVLEITGGGHKIIHSGSSMIAAETGLTNILSKQNARVIINNEESSVPLLSELKNSYRDYFTGASKVVLLRSQQGYPLATYTGNRITYAQTDVPSSTIMIIDGKKLFFYRCDFTVYDSSLIK